MWLQTGKVPYYDRHQNVIGVIVFAIDITEVKTLERKAEQLNRQYSRVHEFTEATLDLMAEAIDRGTSVEELQTYVTNARKQSQTMDRR